MNIKELAKKLNLSITTVSRALGGYSDVSEKTREKVKKYAQKYRYSPNLYASALASGRSKTVGYVLPIYGTHSSALNQANIFKQSYESSDLIGKFQTLILQLQASSEIDVEYKAKAASTSTLVDEDSLYDKAELQWRLSTPISTIVLVLIALMLVDYRPRTSRFSKLPLAIASYAIYYNIMTVSKTWVEQGVLSYVWIPAVVIISVVLFIYFIHNKRTSL